MEDLRVAEHPGMHRYSETSGHAPLVDAIVEKVRANNALACERDQDKVIGYEGIEILADCNIDLLHTVWEKGHG